MSFDFREASFHRLQLDNQETTLMKEVFRIRSQKNKFVPISSLPPEILTQIFLLCRDHRVRLDHKCSEGRTNTQSTYTSLADEWKDKHKLCQSFGFCAEDSMLFVLSLVCSSWHTFVRSTPIFWDVVFLHHPLFIFKGKLSLRRDVPITIRGHPSDLFCCGETFEIDRPIVALNWLLSTRPRIKAIELDLPFAIISEIFFVLSIPPQNLSELKKISLEDVFIMGSFGFATEPSSKWNTFPSSRALLSLPLSVLNLGGVPPPPWLQSTSLSRLQSLTLNFPICDLDGLHDLLRILIACSSMLQNASLSFAVPATHSYHDYLSPQTAQSLTDCLVSHPPIHFRNLMELEIRHWGGYLIHPLLNILDAPRSTCNIRLSSLPDIWDFFDAKPMTAEWGRAIGHYHLYHMPSMRLVPSQSFATLNTSSIRFPIIDFDRDHFGGQSGARAFNIARMVVALQAFVDITHFVLNVATFNKMYLGKTYSDLHNADRSDGTFLHEYSLTDSLYFPEVESYVDDHGEYDILVGVLATIPSLQALCLIGLTGTRCDDQYLGRALSISSPSAVAANVICPRLASLALVYDSQPSKLDKEIYLVWVYQVLISRQRASVAGSVQAITQVEVFVHASLPVGTRREDTFTPEESKVYYNANVQVQRMRSTLGSNVAVSVLSYHGPISNFKYYKPDVKEERRIISCS